ncbi:MAG: heavy metal-associated domain-containing protein [Flavobacteriaceae bacterium]|nr:heavy metal-associated domain-containing protein [Flavobacteriaceae bacterium]
MRTPIILMLLALTFGCTTTPKTEKKTVSHEDHDTVAMSADLTHISFPIEGMTCEIGCAARIEKKIAASEGVALSKVDFDSKTAHVSFDASMTSFEAIGNIIKDLGDEYKVGEAKASSPYMSDKDGKTCDKSCDKPCCAKKKKCDKSCDKPCCASDKKHMDKKACDKSCTKACCASKKK